MTTKIMGVYLRDEIKIFNKYEPGFHNHEMVLQTLMDLQDGSVISQVNVPAIV